MCNVRDNTQPVNFRCEVEKKGALNNNLSPSRVNDRCQSAIPGISYVRSEPLHLQGGKHSNLVNIRTEGR